MAITGVPSVFMGVAPGVPVDAKITEAIEARPPASTFNAQAVKGTAAKFTATPDLYDIATTDTRLAGVLCEDVVDLTTLPSTVQQLLIGQGFYFAAKGDKCTIMKRGRMFVTNVSGSVAANDYLQATTAGKWISTTSTNNLTNGAVICTKGNSAAAGAIEIELDLF